MIHELADLLQVVRLSEIGMSYLADNVLVLHYVHQGSELKRGMFVLKTRGTAHDLGIREFRIEQEGFRLGAPIRV
jgi:circadian clock protein KaiC